MTTMGSARMRLGGEGAWVELARLDEGRWRVAADWHACLTADFTTHLSAEEAADFAVRVLDRLRAPSSSGGGFTERVTPGRNNPLTLRAEPAGGRFALLLRLTPHGDDEVCRLQLELNPVDTEELTELFEALHVSLGGGDGR
ncbi:hypothetical protein ACFVUH_27405 [Kitasatospora sp. NPDC058032]|uniref:hypothetical protein n=1 Tax=Kitasatospora sp. NPDC058032 TaxID=3346307 RepID=UPI0036DCBA9D